MEIENHKEEVPFQHYCELFRAMDPQEAAARTGAAFDGAAFSVRLLNVTYRLTWPEFSMTPDREPALQNLPTQTFLMRFLLEGKQVPAVGGMKTFRELPWGEVYVTPFDGRCLKRAAFSFGFKLPAFRRSFARIGGEPCTHGDASYAIELLPGYRMELILWEGDDEFPPSSQILYSDNFAEGFSAEDRVVAGDILLSALKLNLE